MNSELYYVLQHAVFQWRCSSMIKKYLFFYVRNIFNQDILSHIESNDKILRHGYICTGTWRWVINLIHVKNM